MTFDTQKFLVTLAGIFSITAVFITCSFNLKEVDIKNMENQAKINAQTEIERIKIEEEETTKRTKERMKLIPWYKE